VHTHFDEGLITDQDNQTRGVAVAVVVVHHALVNRLVTRGTCLSDIFVEIT
jgi:hypothetical protein